MIVQVEATVVDDAYNKLAREVYTMSTLTTYVNHFDVRVPKGSNKKVMARVSATVAVTTPNRLCIR